MLGRNGGRKGIVDAYEGTNRVTVLNIVAKDRTGMNYFERLLIGSQTIMRGVCFF